jgi:hypothetical protein
MRRMLIGLTAGAMLLVVGCSDGDGGTSTSSGGGGGGGSTAEFCKDFKDLNEDLNKIDSSDDAAVAAGYKKLDALDPPEEIADDYHKIVGFARDAMEALKNIDSSDPEAVAKAQEQFTSRRAEIEKASNHVDTFLKEECKIDSSASSGE